MRTKKILALLLATVMLVASLAACSTAYDKPGEYLTLPTLSGVVVKYADIQEKIDETIDDLLSGSEGQNYEPVSDKEATVQKGDEIYFDYKGTASVELDEAVKNTLSGEGAYLTIGSNSDSFPGAYTNTNNQSTEDDNGEKQVFHESFEDQLIGAKVSDEPIKIQVQFPNDYSTEALKNVVVDYEVTIHAIARVTVEEDYTIKVSYTVTDKKDDVEDILVPVITTKAPETTTTPESTTAPETTTAAPSTTEAPTTTEKPSFDDLFPAKSGVSLDLDSSTIGTTAFLEIFAVSDVARYMIGKNLYQEFAVQLTVPADYEDEDYVDYLGKDIYVTFTIDSTTSTPELTDYFINKNFPDKYATVAEYNEYLETEYKKSVAYETIYELATIKEYPYDEWEESFKDYVDIYLCEKLAEDDGNSSTTSVSLSDFTPNEIKELISEDEYKEIYTQATYSAREAVKQRLTMEALFDELDITLSRKEFNSKMDEEEENFNANFFYYYYYYGIPTFDAYVSYYGGDEYFELQYKYEKLLEKLPEVVTYEEKPSTAE